MVKERWYWEMVTQQDIENIWATLIPPIDASFHLCGPIAVTISSYAQRKTWCENAHSNYYNDKRNDRSLLLPTCPLLLYCTIDISIFNSMWNSYTKNKYMYLSVLGKMSYIK